MASLLKNIFTKNSELNVNQVIVKKTTIAFLFFFVFIGASFGGWKWLRHQRSIAQGTRPALRKVLNINESIFNGLVSDKHLTKQYPVSKAANPARVNGSVGLQTSFDPATWQMYVLKKNGDTLKLTLDDIKKLPKTEIIFNFKCIEGWNQITYWGGVKFADFIKAYNLGDEASLNYVGLSTPDKQYYVGIDMASAMHPQTLLCYELNEKPLPINQGYPLRLIIPIKYGVKSIKRIGTMYFADQRPRDYWYEKGYDYFAGL